MFLRNMIFAFSILSTVSRADNVTSITGTWTTKSRAVVTGPDFYSPLEEKFHEPRLRGHSISFTDDGYFESGFYTISTNGATPGCPVGIIQWQHGTYTFDINGSLVLFPFPCDGRQLISDPCTSGKGSYTRYNSTQIFKTWSTSMDNYHGEYQLSLAQRDGTLLPPMYLAYRPPRMLPTNPFSSSCMPHRKRSLIPLVNRVAIVDYDALWWFGMSLSFLGTIGYFCF